jgi:hypothetical protein
MKRFINFIAVLSLILIIVGGYQHYKYENRMNTNRLKETKKLIQSIELIEKNNKINNKKECLKKLVRTAKQYKTESDETYFAIRVENYSRDLVFPRIYLSVNDQPKNEYNLMIYPSEFKTINTYPIPIVPGSSVKIEIECR